MVMKGSLVEYFKQTERGINFLDIGASGGPDPKWEPLFNFINYTAFEPHKDSCTKIQSKLKDKFKHLEIYDFALSDFNGNSPLYVTKSTQCSSMLQPNENWLSRCEFRNFFELLGTISFKMER